MAATAASAPRTGGGTGNRLQRRVGLTGLTMISLGSIIGSGWLLGTLTAAQTAGPASLMSWVLAGLILGILALVHAELGASYPVSGGTARFPFISFGALGGFTGGWMAWLQAVTIAPIEVEASLGYLNSRFTSLGVVNSKGVLTGTGIALGAGFMLLFVAINMLGVRWLAESNTITVVWKFLIPTITVIALLAVVFHSHNFVAGGGFAPFGAKGVFAALPLGVVFAAEGFEQAIQVGGEARNPQRDIPRAVIGAMIIGTLLYIALEIAFIGAIKPHNVIHNWLNPIAGTGTFGPYRTLAVQAGIGWLATLLIIDAVVSPAGTGLVYLGTSSRLSYGLGRNGYFPHVIDRIDRRGVPLVSIIIAFVIGMIVFLPFPSWKGLVGLVTSATVLMYAMAPPTLAALRRTDPTRPRPYRLPVYQVLCPVAFICANFIVYWAGFDTDVWLYIFIAAGFILFAIYQASLPPERRTIIAWRAGVWIVPWLAGLLLISWQGQFTTPPYPFGVTLKNTGNIPFWWDLVTLTGFSLAIYFWAIYSGLRKDQVDVAVRDVEVEAALQDAELEPGFAGGLQ